MLEPFQYFPEENINAITGSVANIIFGYNPGSV